VFFKKNFFTFGKKLYYEKLFTNSKKHWQYFEACIKIETCLDSRTLGYCAYTFKNYPSPIDKCEWFHWAAYILT